MIWLIGFIWISSVLSLQIDSVCGPGNCLHKDHGCVVSHYGIACSECSDNGFIEENIPSFGFPETFRCNCYFSQFDPENFCQQVRGSDRSLEINVKRDRATCTPWYSKITGFFFSSGSIETHVYGREDPPIPNQCALPVLGPKRGQIIESLTVPLQTCNTYGTSNPDREFGPDLDISFQTCAGHGTWNRTTYRCEFCDDGWSLQVLENQKGIDNEDVVVCNECSGFRGPRVDSGKEAPFCRQIYTPDPIDGIERECGGHGIYFFGGICSCFANSTHGFWNVTQLSHTFAEYQWSGSSLILEDNLVTVPTCITCADGYGPNPLDNIDDGEDVPCSILLPTPFPTQNPTINPV